MDFERIIAGGSTNVMLYVPIRQSSTGGNPGDLAIGLVNTDVYVYWIREGDATGTAVSLSAGTQGSYGASTFVETSIPGMYQICFANAVFAAGVKSVLVYIYGTSVQTTVHVTLTTVDLQASGGVVDANAVTWDSNPLPTAFDLNADQQVDVTKWGGTAIATAVVRSNLVQWGGVNYTVSDLIGDLATIGVLSSLNSMISAGKFTVSALSNAPSGTGGDATAANQTSILAALAAPVDTPGTTTLLTRVTAGVLASLNSMITGNAFTSGALANAPVASVTSGNILSIAAAVWNEAKSGHVTSGTFGSLLDAKVSTVGGNTGAGAHSYVVTVTENSLPLDGVALWVSTDAQGQNVVAGPIYTTTLGTATFLLDVGTYYLWKQLSGVNFTNPETITVT